MGAVAVPGTEAEGQDMGRQPSDIKRLLVESGHSLLLQRVEGIGVTRSKWTPINALAVMSSRLQDVPVDPSGLVRFHVPRVYQTTGWVCPVATFTRPSGASGDGATSTQRHGAQVRVANASRSGNPGHQRGEKVGSYIQSIVSPWR
ncbi:MAG: hypothetical protein ACI9GK_002188 [Devosia sp.]|jgi:hypothetical protein